MKLLIRLIMIVAAMLFALVAVIKIIKGCSWKDAVGILEELCKEISESCACSSDSESTD